MGALVRFSIVGLGYYCNVHDNIPDSSGLDVGVSAAFFSFSLVLVEFLSFAQQRRFIALLPTGRRDHQKDAELLVAPGPHPGHSAHQPTHRQPLCVSWPQGDRWCYRGEHIKHEIHQTVFIVIVLFSHLVLFLCNSSGVASYCSTPQVIADELPDANKLPLELSGLQRPQLLETIQSCLPEWTGNQWQHWLPVVWVIHHVHVKLRAWLHWVKTFLHGPAVPA